MRFSVSSCATGRASGQALLSRFSWKSRQINSLRRKALFKLATIIRAGARKRFFYIRFYFCDNKIIWDREQQLVPDEALNNVIVSNMIFVISGSIQEALLATPSGG